MSGRSTRRFRGAAVAVLLAAGSALGLVGPPSPASAASTGQVYLVQGIVGVAGPVSVAVDGLVVQPRVTPEAVVGPVRLAAGQHVAEFRTGASVLVAARFTVTPGATLDVVAHRAADSAMSPALTVFRNDLSPVRPGTARLMVSNVAVAPPADIRVDGEPLFRNIANGESLSLTLPARTYSVDAVPTATDGRPILGPIRVALRPGILTRIFAVGTVADGSTDAIVQDLPVPVAGAGVPRFVHTGDGGQAARQSVASSGVTGSLAPVPALVAALAALVALAAVGIRRGRGLPCVLRLWGGGAACVGALIAIVPGPAPAPAPSLADGAPGRSVVASPVLPELPGPVGAQVPVARVDPGRPVTASFRPTVLVLPHGVTAPVLDSGVRPDGSLVIPEDPGTVGRWTGGAWAGDPFGAVVVAGHVDSARYGLGVMARLWTVRPGEEVDLRDGVRRQRYRVTGREEIGQSEPARLGDAFRQDVPARLVLITCAGPFDPVRHRYRDNLLLFAEPFEVG